MILVAVLLMTMATGLATQNILLASVCALLGYGAAAAGEFWLEDQTERVVGAFFLCGAIWMMFTIARWIGSSFLSFFGH